MPQNRNCYTIPLLMALLRLDQYPAPLVYMLTTAQIISPSLSNDALLIAGSDHTFSVYFHRSSGPASIGAGSSLPQSINTLLFPQHLLDHSFQQFDLISSSVKLDFSPIEDPDSADVCFYYDSEIVLSDSPGLTFGLVLFNYDYESGRRWLEVFFNGPVMDGSPLDLQYYVFNHELLHVLGLEHPFDDSDGDFYLSVDPQSSATPEETVMSYRPPQSGTYPIDITDLDSQALRQIWGYPNSIYRLFQPSKAKHLYTSNIDEIDYLTGLGSSSFINEGVAYVVSPSATDDLFRFYHPTSGHHLYSANVYERDFLIHNTELGYLYEGVAYSVIYDNSSPLHTPVFRLFDPDRFSHFYTSSVSEIQAISLSHPNWINEGIAWYV